MGRWRGRPSQRREAHAKRARCACWKGGEGEAERATHEIQIEVVLQLRGIEDLKEQGTRTSARYGGAEMGCASSRGPSGRALKGDLAIFLVAFLHDGGVIPRGPVAPTGDSEYGESSRAPAPADSELKRSTFEELREGEAAQSIASESTQKRAQERIVGRLCTLASALQGTQWLDATAATVCRCIASACTKSCWPSPGRASQPPSSSGLRCPLRSSLARPR